MAPEGFLATPEEETLLAGLPRGLAKAITEFGRELVLLKVVEGERSGV